jgi:hypothetical protein
LLYWKEKEVLNYPNAKRMVQYFENKVAEMNQLAEMQAGMQNMQMTIDGQNQTIQQLMNPPKDPDGEIKGKLDEISRRLGG